MYIYISSNPRCLMLFDVDTGVFFFIFCIHHLQPLGAGDLRQAPQILLKIWRDLASNMQWLTVLPGKKQNSHLGHWYINNDYWYIWWYSRPLTIQKQLCLEKKKTMVINGLWISWHILIQVMYEFYVLCGQLLGCQNHWPAHWTVAT